MCLHENSRMSFISLCDWRWILDTKFLKWVPFDDIMKLYSFDERTIDFQSVFNRWMFSANFTHVREKTLKMIFAGCEIQPKGHEKCHGWSINDYVNYTENQLKTKHSRPSVKCILIQRETIERKFWINHRYLKRARKVLPCPEWQINVFELHISVSSIVINARDCCERKWWNKEESNTCDECQR